jgi:hypothetical protein
MISTRVLSSVIAPLAIVIALAVPGPATAQSDPVIGSSNVATADPPIPSPSSTPCTVTLFENLQFADFNSKPFDFEPPADCPRPWQKVVLSADYSVTMGRQFDRTAEIWLGGAIIYFGTTQEPQATVAPSWHIERDLTGYSALFAEAHGGQATLGNFVGNSGGVDYTGIIFGTATLSFYPGVPTVTDHPRRPDVLLPLSASADGSTADLSPPDAKFGVTFVHTLPTNIERAFLDVYAQSQAGDEFWYTCVPDELADALFSCGGTAFREAEVFVDDQPAGVAPIYPWVYTGGIDPYLWRPIPGVQTLAFEPYRVDLTPFAGLLDDGAAHTIAISVFNAQDHFSTTANLLLYLDHGKDQLSGAVTANTLAAAPSPQVTTAINGDDTSVNVTSSRQFSISGTLDTSRGTVNTQVTQTLAFSNAQQFTITDSVYHQHVVQATTIDSTTTTTNGKTTAIVHEQRSYPFVFDYDQEPTADGNYTLASTIDQEFKQSVAVGFQGFMSRSASLDNHVVAGDTFDIDGDGNLTGHHGQGTTQTYSYSDPFGACYSRKITATSGVLTTLTDGTGCGSNRLSWFDIFHNYASSVAGATVQLLP